MSFSKILSKLRRYDENAAVIFDREEPVGHVTDLVMQRPRWFKRRQQQKNSGPRSLVAVLPNEQ